MSASLLTQELGNRLLLRPATAPDDVERVATFNALIHGTGTEPTWRAWMREHPHADPTNWFLVEDTATRQVVASLGLIPWQLRYEGIKLRAAEMGVVGTLEPYRNRGLQRALNARFDHMLRVGGYLLSHIQGIPFFYRQFGYEYALPLEAWWRIELEQLPDTPAERGFGCRPAMLADSALLSRFYAEAVSHLDIAAERDPALWPYLLGPGLATETAAETWIVEDAAATPVGYLRIAQHGFGEGLIVAEASELQGAAAGAAFELLRRLAAERGKPFVRLNLPASSAFVVAAAALGARDGGAYAWQVRLPDPVALLQTVAPVFERRVVASAFAGLTRDVVLDFYRQAIVLRFVAGRIAAVQATTRDAPALLRLPPPLLAPLLFGHRSLDEMRPMYPDASVAEDGRELIDVLFPKLRGWLYQPY
jgi:predicted N-acetyltransferase YhbS